MTAELAPRELMIQGAKSRLEYWQAVLDNAGANDARVVREAADFIQQYSKLIAEMVGIDSHPR